MLTLGNCERHSFSVHGELINYIEIKCSRKWNNVYIIMHEKEPDKSYLMNEEKY